MNLHCVDLEFSNCPGSTGGDTFPRNQRDRFVCDLQQKSKSRTLADSNCSTSTSTRPHHACQQPRQEVLSNEESSELLYLPPSLISEVSGFQSSINDIYPSLSRRPTLMCIAGACQPLFANLLDCKLTHCADLSLEG